MVLATDAVEHAITCSAIVKILTTSDTGIAGGVEEVLLGCQATQAYRGLGASIAALDFLIAC